MVLFTCTNNHVPVVQIPIGVTLWDMQFFCCRITTVTEQSTLQGDIKIMIFFKDVGSSYSNLVQLLSTDTCLGLQI